jgi:hypothetical protein
MRVRDVDELRDVILTYPGTPATTFDMTGVTAAEPEAGVALKKALDAIAGGEGSSLSIRLCQGELADVLRAAGFGPGTRYHLSVRN